MARVTIADENRTLKNADDIRAFLAPYGLWYEQWPVDDLDPDATDEQILDHFSTEIERLKERGGFVTADVINVTADTPGLSAMLDKFNKEHTHSEDEVRFTVAGRGVFHIHGMADNAPERVFAIQVDAGDLINVPRGTQHWFELCEDRSIRCIRLFEEMSGWTPEYVENGVHERYQPVCWGPSYLEGDRYSSRIEPV